MDKYQSLNVIDLFCGCGGLSFGFEQAGFKVLLGIDNDAIALQTFSLNHKNAKTICGDITKINYESIMNVIGNQQVDVIVGGPPCQGMSLSGPRQFQDERNRLYLSFIRIVDEIKPKAFVVENVPGLVSLFKGAIKDNILKEFRNLGYRVKYQILNAADYGVPQYRKRVIFVGLRDVDFTFPGPTSIWNPVTCEMALSDLPTLENELGDGEQNYIYPPLSDYQTLMRLGSSKIYNHVAANHSEIVKKIISLVPEGENYKVLPEEYRNTRNFHVAWTRFPRNKPAPTIDTGHRHHFHYEFNRVPTVRECARIQSFPDTFKFLGNKTQQFKQVGNAVPPILAKSIAMALRKEIIAKETENNGI